MPRLPKPLPNPLLPLLALALLLAAGSAWSQAARRVALVIGNNAYASAPLLNPVNDAREMAQALGDAGFAVLLRTDATQPQIAAALREFGERLRAGGTGAVGVFYFAGHGMQIRGRNFLIPVGANIEHEDEVPYQAVDAQAVLDKMESAGNGTNLVILDACRNNPFARSFRSVRQGLAQMDAPVGTLVAFSTAPGAVASDGTGSNGLYTAHLLTAMRTPGLKVEDVFKQVRGAVRRESGGRQTPWEATSLEGDFYFVPLAPAAPAAPPAAPAIDVDAALDDALWQAVRGSTRSAEIHAYLHRFPNGRHARDARQRLADLVAPAAAAAPAGPATPALASATAPAAVASLAPAAAVDAERLLQPLPTGDQERLAEQQRARDLVEELVRWGDAGTDRRPAQPRRNAHGSAEGDRFRYLKTDLRGRGATDTYLWRVDRIEPDGSLWVNDGAQRLDPRGQRVGGNDEHSGAWLDWAPALPLAELAARGPGAAQAVAVSVRSRDANDRRLEFTLSGVATTRGDFVKPPRGVSDLLAAVRIELDLRGFAVDAAGARRSVRWNHTYWMVPGVALPVWMEFEHSAGAPARADGTPLFEAGRDALLEQHTLHQLIALDLLQAPPVLAGMTR